VKIGAENKKEVRLMIVLVIVAVLVGVYEFRNLGTSSAAPPATTPTGTQKKGPPIVDSTLDPRFRWDRLERSQRIKYEAGRNIFTMQEVKVEQPKFSVRPGEMGPPAPPTPTPTPPPPPIKVKFYGFASKPGEPKRIFLSDEGELFVAKQGDIVERKYKVVQINNTSVIIEDVLNNNRQPIPLTPK
jgi:hypothetical protein